MEHKVTVEEAHCAAVLEELLASRSSTRAFQARPVPREVIEKILRMASATPSWCNTQPWEAVIVSGKAADRFRDALYAHATTNPPTPDIPFPERYEGVFRERRREAGLALYDAIGIARGDRAASARQTLENFRLFGAPHAAIVTTDATLGVYGAIDCGLFLQSFLLAAESLGVATIPQAALASQAPFIREYFDLPDTRQVVFGVSFGYADADHPVNSFRTTRVDLPAHAVQWFSD